MKKIIAIIAGSLLVGTLIILYVYYRGGQGVPAKSSQVTTNEVKNSPEIIKNQHLYTENQAITGDQYSVREKIELYKQVAKEDPSVALDLARSIAACTEVVGYERIEQHASNDEIFTAAEYELSLSEACKGIGRSDYILAVDLAEQAARSGLTKAKVEYELIAGQIFFLDEFRFDTDGLIKYKKNALGYLTEAAGVGNQAAMYRLSSLYEEGKITKKNDKLAYHYFEMYINESGNTSASSMKILEELRANANRGSR